MRPDFSLLVLGVASNSVAIVVAIDGVSAAGWWFKHQILSTTRACDVKRPRDDLDYFCYSRKIESKLRNKKAYFLLDSARNQTLILCIFWFRVKLLNPLEFPKHYNFEWQWQVRNGFVSIPKHNIRTSSP